MRVMRVKCVLEKIICHVERLATFKKSCMVRLFDELIWRYRKTVSTYAEQPSNIHVQERNAICSNIGRGKNQGDGMMLCMTSICFLSVTYPTLYIRCATLEEC